MPTVIFSFRPATTPGFVRAELLTLEKRCVYFAALTCGFGKFYGRSIAMMESQSHTRIRYASRSHMDGSHALVVSYSSAVKSIDMRATEYL
jgi:hypothetical protein